jgi:hypothetical protein
VGASVASSKRHLHICGIIWERIEWAWGGALESAEKLKEPAPMTIVDVYHLGMEFQAARVTREQGAMESVRCRSRDELIRVLHKWGVANPTLTDALTELETSDHAELRM